jgi:hypothetical protein
MKLISGCAALLAASACVPAAAASACTGYDIVIVAGQSNAVGRGVYGTWAYPHPEVAARVFQVTRTYVDGKPNVTHYITTAQFAIAQAAEPLDNDSALPSGADHDPIGFTYAFAQSLAAAETDATRCVLIVPAARSGTSVLNWNLTPKQFVGDITFFYLDMIHRTRLALSLLPNTRVAAFLWQQGEEDVDVISSIKTTHPSRLAPVMPNIASYHRNLASVMAQVRRSLGCGFPLLLGEMAPSFISDYSTDPAIEANAEATKAGITGVIRQVAAAEPCADGQFVASTGLLTNGQEPDKPASVPPDFEHFSAAGQIGLAARYFAAYQAKAE